MRKNMRELIRRLMTPVLCGFAFGALTILLLEKRGLFAAADWADDVSTLIDLTRQTGTGYFYYLTGRRQFFFLILGIAVVVPGGFFFTSVLAFCFSMAYGGALSAFVIGQGAAGTFLFLRLILPTILFGLPPFLFLSAQTMVMSKRYEKGTEISRRWMGRQIVLLVLTLAALLALSLFESVVGLIMVKKF